MRVLHDWLLTPQRVAVHLPSRTAVIADPHLGYAEARRRRGEAVPDESMSAIMEPLYRVMKQHDVRRLIVAGDLLEESGCLDALAAFEEWLRQAGMELAALVPGNHDIGLETRAGLPIHSEGVTLDGWRIVHGDGPLPDAPLVHGHDHPCLRWSPKRRAIRPPSSGNRIAPWAIDSPCYLIGAQRLILPAFSLEAAGANILSLRRWRALRCCVVAEDRVLDLGEVATLRSRLSAARGSTRIRERPSAD
jgi:metallophosphoesterase superfamily enzyme